MKNRRIIGMDIGGTKTAAGVVDSNGIVDRLIVQASPFSSGIDAVKRMVKDVLKELLSSHFEDVAGVGVAASGRIDPESGRVVGGVPLCDGYIGLGLRDFIEKTVSLPVHVENDANAAAFAEYKLGAGRGAHRLLCLTVGTGIGGGIVIDGKLLRGKGNAGEIGHIIIEHDGRPCPCGQRGCLETYVSRKVIQAEIADAIRRRKIKTALNPDSLTTEDLISLIREEEPESLAIFNKCMDYLATGITNCINTIDPDTIVLSGQLSLLGDVLVESLTSRIRFPVRITIGELVNHAGLIGAALAAYERIVGV